MMTDIKKSLKVNAADSCYYAAFTMYCFFHLMERTNYVYMFGVAMDSIGKIANALMLILLLVRFFSIRFTTDALVCSGIGFLVSLITLGVTKSWIPLSICLFIIAGNGIDIRRLTKIVLVVTVLVFLIVAFGLISGSINSIDSIRPGETKVRHSLGFNQVNALGAVLARICTCVVYLRWNKSPLLSVLLSSTSVFFLEMVANSRTAELYLLVLICFQVYCYIRRQSFTSASKSRICLYLVIGSFLLTVILLFVFLLPTPCLWLLVSLLATVFIQCGIYSNNIRYIRSAMAHCFLGRQSGLVPLMPCSPSIMLGHFGLSITGLFQLYFY